MVVSPYVKSELRSKVKRRFPDGDLEKVLTGAAFTAGALIVVLLKIWLTGEL